MKISKFKNKLNLNENKTGFYFSLTQNLGSAINEAIAILEGYNYFVTTVDNSKRYNGDLGVGLS